VITERKIEIQREIENKGRNCKSNTYNSNSILRSINIKIITRIYIGFSYNHKHEQIMVLSRGLLISIAFTTLIGVLLFLYIRQKTSTIETKINTLFQLVQEEAAQQQRLQYEQRQRAMQIEETTPQGVVMSGGGADTADDLISVSDGSDDSDVDTDDDVEGEEFSEDELSEGSHDESDTDSEYEGGGGEYHIDEEDGIQMEIDLTTGAVIMEGEEAMDMIKTIMMEDMISNVDTTIASPQKLEELTGIEGDDLKNGEGDDIDDIETIEQIALDEGELDAYDEREAAHIKSAEGEDKDGSDTKDGDASQEIALNYKKLPVGKLRDIVASKSLHEDPKKLKKAELIKLLDP